MQQSRARGLVGQLVEALGAARVTDCVDAPDGDPRTALHVSGRPIGRPVAWVRPWSTEACVRVMELAGAAGVPVVPVGEATTFWDGLRVEGVVALDVRALNAPLVIDAPRRLAWVGAGVTLRAIDEAARAQGLALASYPDTDGGSPAASLLAVGTTAGLGLGRGLPVEHVSAATLVTRSGEVVRAGASHVLGAPCFARDGFPHVLSLITAGEGRMGVITEVGILLVAAAPLAVATLQANRAGMLDTSAWLEALELARSLGDEGSLDGARIELLGDGASPPRCELTLRTYAPVDVARADQSVRAAAATCAGFSLESVNLVGARESAGRWSMPPGSHRARLGGCALWGVEVAVGWGPELGRALSRFAALYDGLLEAAPAHRRMGIYPSAHAVSIGVQVLAPPGGESVERARAIMHASLPELLALGAVPYRVGNLWREAMGARFEGASPAGVVERAVAAIEGAR